MDNCSWLMDRGTNETPSSESKGGRQKLHLGPRAAATEHPLFSPPPGRGFGSVVWGPTWPLGRWVRWPVIPTGTGAGSSPVPAAGGQGLRPRVFLAHRSLPQHQVHAPASAVLGR
jgi:hypothetical protein